MSEIAIKKLLADEQRVEQLLSGSMSLDLGTMNDQEDLRLAEVGKGEFVLALPEGGDRVRVLGVHRMSRWPGTIHQVNRRLFAPLRPDSEARGGVLLANTAEAWGRTVGDETRLWMTPPIKKSKIVDFRREFKDSGTVRKWKMTAGLTPYQAVDGSVFGDAELVIVPTDSKWLKANPGETREHPATPVWMVYLGTAALSRVARFGSAPRR